MGEHSRRGARRASSSIPCPLLSHPWTIPGDPRQSPADQIRFPCSLYSMQSTVFTNIFIQDVILSLVDHDDVHPALFLGFQELRHATRP